MCDEPLVVQELTGAVEEVKVMTGGQSGRLMLQGKQEGQQGQEEHGDEEDDEEGDEEDEHALEDEGDEGDEGDEEPLTMQVPKVRKPVKLAPHPSERRKQSKKRPSRRVADQCGCTCDCGSGDMGSGERSASKVVNERRGGKPTHFIEPRHYEQALKYETQWLPRSYFKRALRAMQGETAVVNKMTSLADVALAAIGMEGLELQAVGDMAGLREAVANEAQEQGQQEQGQQQQGQQGQQGHQGQQEQGQQEPDKEDDHDHVDGDNDDADDGGDTQDKIAAASMRRATRQLLLLPITLAGLDRLFELLTIDRHATFASRAQWVTLLQAQWRGGNARQRVINYRRLVVLCLRAQRKFRLRRCLRVVAAAGRRRWRDKCACRIQASILKYRGRRYVRRVLALGARILSAKKAREETPWAFADEDAETSDDEANEENAVAAAAARAAKAARRKKREQARRRWQKGVLFRTAFQMYMPDADHGRELSRAALSSGIASGSQRAPAGQTRSRRDIEAGAGVSLAAGQAGLKRHILMVMPPLPASLRATWEREERAHRRGYDTVQTNIFLTLEEFVALSEEEQEVQQQREKEALAARWRSNDTSEEKRRRRKRVRRYEGETNIGSADGHAGDFHAGRRRRGEMSSKAYLTVTVFDPTTCVLAYYSLSRDQLEECIRGTGACTTERAEERLAPHALASLAQCLLYRERSANDQLLGMPKFKMVMRSLQPATSLASRLGAGRALLLYRRHLRFATDESSYLVSIYTSTGQGAGTPGAARRRNSLAGDGGGDQLDISCYDPLSCTELSRSFTLADIEAALTLTEADDSQLSETKIRVRDGAMVLAVHAQNNRDFIDEQLGGQGGEASDNDGKDQVQRAEGDNERDPGTGTAMLGRHHRPKIAFPKRSGDLPYPPCVPPDPLTKMLQTAMVEAAAIAARHARNAARAVVKMEYSVGGNLIGAMSPLEERQARAAARANNEPSPDFLDASVTAVTAPGESAGSGAGCGGSHPKAMAGAGSAGVVAIKCEMCGDVVPKICVGKNVIRSMRTSYQLMPRVRKRKNAEAQERRSVAVMAAVENEALAESRAAGRDDEEEGNDDGSGARKKKKHKLEEARWPWVEAASMPRRAELKWLRRSEVQKRLELKREDQRVKQLKDEEWAQSQKDTAPLTDAQREVQRIEELMETKRLNSLKGGERRRKQQAEEAEKGRVAALQQWQVELEQRAEEEKRKNATAGTKKGMAAVPQWCVACYRMRADHRDYFDHVSGRGRNDSVYAQALRHRQKERASAILVLDGREDGQKREGGEKGEGKEKESSLPTKRRTVKWAQNEEFEYTKGSEPVELLLIVDEQERQEREKREKQKMDMEELARNEEQEMRQKERKLAKEPSLLEIVRELRYGKLRTPTEKWAKARSGGEQPLATDSKRPLFQRLVSFSQQRLLRWLAGSLFICRERELLAIGGHGSAMRKVYNAGCTCRAVGCRGECVMGLALVQELIAGRHRASEVLQRWWRCLRARLEARARVVLKLVLVKWNPPIGFAAQGKGAVTLAGLDVVDASGSEADESDAGESDAGDVDASNNGKGDRDEKNTSEADDETECRYYYLNLRTQSCVEWRPASELWRSARARMFGRDDSIADKDGGSSQGVDKHFHFRNTLNGRVQWEEKPFDYMVRCGAVGKVLTTERWIKLRKPLDIVDQASVPSSSSDAAHTVLSGPLVRLRRGAGLDTRAAAVAAVIVDSKAHWQEQWQVHTKSHKGTSQVLAPRSELNPQHAGLAIELADVPAGAKRSDGGNISDGKSERNKNNAIVKSTDGSEDKANNSTMGEHGGNSSESGGSKRQEKKRGWKRWGTRGSDSSGGKRSTATKAKALKLGIVLTVPKRKATKVVELLPKKERGVKTATKTVVVTDAKAAISNAVAAASAAARSCKLSACRAKGGILVARMRAANSTAADIARTAAAHAIAAVAAQWVFYLQPSTGRVSRMSPDAAARLMQRALFRNNEYANTLLFDMRSGIKAMVIERTVRVALYRPNTHGHTGAAEGAGAPAGRGGGLVSKARGKDGPPAGVGEGVYDQHGNEIKTDVYKERAPLVFNCALYKQTAEHQYAEARAMYETLFKRYQWPPTPQPSTVRSSKGNGDSNNTGVRDRTKPKYETGAAKAVLPSPPTAVCWGYALLLHAERPEEERPRWRAEASRLLKFARSHDAAPLGEFTGSGNKKAAGTGTFRMQYDLFFRWAAVRAQSNPRALVNFALAQELVLEDYGRAWTLLKRAAKRANEQMQEEGVAGTGRQGGGRQVQQQATMQQQQQIQMVRVIRDEFLGRNPAFAAAMYERDVLEERGMPDPDVRCREYTHSRLYCYVENKRGTRSYLEYPLEALPSGDPLPREEAAIRGTISEAEAHRQLSKGGRTARPAAHLTRPL
jgi:hypothetical protein